MKIGVIVPQGWTGEYKGWSATDAWSRTRDVAWQAEALGFESIWLFDHFHTVPRPHWKSHSKHSLHSQRSQPRRDASSSGMSCCVPLIATLP
jgi:alkanesulfonate monooxygenase SsuD/methylene tetrahydromethanopterin reductase-like flavin-dependent oxidoreductase (luciferase family)